MVLGSKFAILFSYILEVNLALQAENATIVYPIFLTMNRFGPMITALTRYMSFVLAVRRSKALLINSVEGTGIKWRSFDVSFALVLNAQNFPPPNVHKHIFSGLTKHFRIVLH